MTATTEAPPSRVPHLEVLRLVPMVGVVATHTLVFTQPAASTVSNAALMFLHANREIFFFVSAFVLGGRRRPTLRRHAGEPESPTAGAPVLETATPSPL